MPKDEQSGVNNVNLAEAEAVMNKIIEDDGEPSEDTDVIAITDTPEVPAEEEKGTEPQETQPKPEGDDNEEAEKVDDEVQNYTLEELKELKLINVDRKRIPEELQGFYGEIKGWQSEVGREKAELTEQKKGQSVTQEVLESLKEERKLNRDDQNRRAQTEYDQQLREEESLMSEEEIAERRQKQENEDLRSRVHMLESNLGKSRVEGQIQHEVDKLNLPPEQRNDYEELLTDRIYKIWGFNQERGENYASIANIAAAYKEKHDGYMAKITSQSKIDKELIKSKYPEIYKDIGLDAISQVKSKKGSLQRPGEPVSKTAPSNLDKEAQTADEEIDEMFDGKSPEDLKKFLHGLSDPL